jgi:hypothetical protein
VLSLTGLIGCGDGTPAFCTTLAERSELEELTAALGRGDLSAARNEAERFAQLAEEAPSELRGDLAAIGESVVQIVDLLALETDDPSQEGAADPDAQREADQRRADLNEQLGDLDERSRRVSAWALEECGLELDLSTE